MHRDARTLRRFRHRIGLARADHILEHGLAGNAVAEFLGPVESRRVDGHHRHAPALFRRLAHRQQIVADHRGDAGGVDENSRRRMTVDGLFDGMEQALLAAPHHDVLLGQVSGHADAEQARPGRARAAVVPRIAGTGDRPMHDVRDVGNRIQRDLRAIERTTAGGGTRLRARAAALLLVRVVRTSRLVDQQGDVAGSHGGILSPLPMQSPCHG